MVDGKLFFNIFSEVRAAEHARMKKPIAKYFSPNGVAPLEPHVDAVVAHLCKALDERFGDGQAFDFGRWMIFCTFASIFQDAANSCSCLGCGRQDDLEQGGGLSRQGLRL